jgi:hypothetical protein
MGRQKRDYQKGTTFVCNLGTTLSSLTVAGLINSWRVDSIFVKNFGENKRDDIVVPYGIFFFIYLLYIKNDLNYLINTK